MAANTVDAWYQKLKLLAEDNALRDQIYQNAKAHCLSRYNVKRVWSELEETLIKYPELSTYTVYKRLEQIIFHLRFRNYNGPNLFSETYWSVFKSYWMKYGVLTLFIAAWKVARRLTLWMISKFKRK